MHMSFYLERMIENAVYCVHLVLATAAAAKKPTFSQKSLYQLMKIVCLLLHIWKWPNALNEEVSFKKSDFETLFGKFALIFA